jgi:hypothetical protein
MPARSRVPVAAFRRLPNHVATHMRHSEPPVRCHDEVRMPQCNLHTRIERHDLHALSSRMCHGRGIPRSGHVIDVQHAARQESDICGKMHMSDAWGAACCLCSDHHVPVNGSLTTLVLIVLDLAPGIRHMAWRLPLSMTASTTVSGWRPTTQLVPDIVSLRIAPSCGVECRCISFRCYRSGIPYMASTLF